MQCSIYCDKIINKPFFWFLCLPHYFFYLYYSFIQTLSSEIPPSPQLSAKDIISYVLCKIIQIFYGGIYVQNIFIISVYASI